MQPFLDAQGMMIVEMPFPPTWKVARAAGPGEPKITGPHGIQVFDFPGLNFLHTHDPRMRQVYAASGQPLRPVPRHSAPKSSLDEKLKNSLI